ncbi:MAG: stage II sporulation protein P [Firmicutes bacterium]|nr:stage II sporulation protein P [Bacillota bacterium]
MARFKEWETEKNGPGLFFVLIALVVVAVLGARYLGFYPSDGDDIISTQTEPPVVTEISEPVGPVVAVYHTHTCQNYAPKTSFSKGQPGDIVDVGTAFMDALEVRGIAAVHSKSVHDYPVFRAAYENAAATVAATVGANSSLQMVFDIHRDGLPASAKPERVTTSINGQEVARILLVVGKDNPAYAQNLAFAKELQARMEEMYPGLCRGVITKEGTYNQGQHPQSVAVYIGSYPQNTVDQAKRSAKLFAEVVATMVQEPI